MEIRKLRKAKGWTQEQLAKELNINRATLSKYENGQIEPSISMLRKICNTIDCNLTDIMPADEVFLKIDSILEGEATYINNIKEAMNTAAAEHLRDKAEKFLLEENGRVIISAYYLLNKAGQDESVKRIVELSDIPKYQRQLVSDESSPESSDK